MAGGADAVPRVAFDSLPRRVLERYGRAPTFKMHSVVRVPPDNEFERVFSEAEQCETATSALW
jgi:hypothetical protein